MQKKKILFISAAPQSMMIKMFNIMKKHADIHLFSISNNFDKKQFSKICKSIKTSNAFDEHKYKRLKIFPLLIKLILDIISLKKINPDIVIAEGEPNWTCALSKKIFKNKKFVFFPYDITQFTLKIRKKVQKYELIAEKYCFENSDIIIHKGPKEELNWLGYKIGGKQIQYLPACSKDMIKPIKKHTKKTPQLVYIGLIPQNSDELDIQWTEQLATFAKQDMKTHIYPTTPFYMKDKNIVIHKKLPQAELNEIMGNYEYGLYTASYKTFKKDNRWMDSTIGNKLFSYFEAGIPVIVLSNYKYISHLVRKYNCGVIIEKKDFPNLKKILEKQNYAKLIKGVEKIRKEMTIEDYTEKLIQSLNLT